MEVAGAGLVVAEAVGLAGDVDNDRSVQESVSSAAATVLSPRTWPHSVTGRLVVMMIEDLR